MIDLTCLNELTDVRRYEALLKAIQETVSVL